MSFVWKYLKGSLTGLIIATLMSTLSGLGIVYIMRSFHQAVKKGLDNPTMFFTSVGIGLLVFIVFGLISEKTLSRITNRIILEMRIDFSNLIFQSEYEEVEGKKKELFSSMISDINGLSRIIEKLPGANRNFVIALAGIIYLVTISWLLTLIMIAFFGVTYLIILRRNVLAYKLTMSSRKSWDAVYNNIHDIIYGIKELSLNSSQKDTFIENHLKKSGEIEAQNKISLRFFNQATGKMSETVMILGICCMILLSISVDVLNMSAFAEFLTISLFIVNPLSSVSNFTKDLVPLKVYTTHIQEIGIELSNAKDDSQEDRIELESINQFISLQNAEYTYRRGDDSHFHLGPVSMEIPANQITIIYGSNGSGKTTLSKVIAGLYKIEKGQLVYGNEQINRNNLQSFRNKISAVFADNHLFKNNDISQDQLPRVQELLQLFSIDNHVQIENNTVIHKGLSTGQSKRLALVLSMIAEKEIYIFDEWAANQDPQFKKAFYHQLIPQLKEEGKTVILITHDDQYFDIADHKIHLQEGKVV
ncbi:ATP-binding cassette domain-containing protein [Marinoscillum pacificum]|uniref:ATP-binding cassette domain-containing protein n=1 Tax=Marinoscillum pacificum TaxID=392723 RepID=UPI0021587B61|nr:ATP-binding cassette domain-containing protein [Marinoscillum pacificum]